MIDFAETFKEIVGREITQAEDHAFKVYEDELCAWNEKINLAAIRDREDIRIKHFLDSLTCLPALGELEGLKLIDVGTGGGFPGLPIKICCPSVRLNLVDSVGKKLDFCRAVIEKIALHDVEVIQSRAEDLGQNPAYRGNYDRAVARAVAALPVLLEYLLPLLKVGGKAVIQKGENGPLEFESATKALKVLRGEAEKIEPVQIPGITEARYLIVIRKAAPTPAQYPRRAGIPARKPIS